MTKKVTLRKIMEDGEFLLERNGTYFRLSVQNIKDLQELLPDEPTCEHDFEARRDRDGIFVYCQKCTLCIPVRTT